MRALNRVLGFLSIVALSSAVAGCGTDVKGKISCTDDATCVAASNALYSQVDASPEQLPKCCAGACLVLSLGCETGWRYFTSAPAVGECVATDPMCPGGFDMTMVEPADMKMPSHD